MILLSVLAAASVAGMSWLGWRLILQEEIIAAQRSQEEIQQSADRLVALSRGRLAELNQQLSIWMVTLPQNAQLDNGVFVMKDGDAITPFPPSRLLYRPDPAREPEASPALFEAAESAEFRGKGEQAAAAYRALAAASNPRLRAGALLRLARVLRNSGRKEEAIGVYEQLVSIAATGPAGVPAALVARHAIAELRGRREDARALRDDLLQARWMLDRGPFLYYLSEAVKLAAQPAPPATLALAEAAYSTLVRSNDLWPEAGEDVAWENERPFLLVWQRDLARKGVFVLDLEALLKEIAVGEVTTWSVVDRHGRPLAGERDGTGGVRVRSAIDTALPWTIYVSPPVVSQNARSKGTFLRVGLGLLLLLLLLGSWFTLRAIQREAEVSRLQTDFVAGVSHEFRSPLSSLRHLSDMLMLGRVPDEDRRQQYYQGLVSETARLQRLVESLLNFGRMEAGASRYSREQVNIAELARATAGTFESQEARDRITTSGPEDCSLDADSDALGVALRNLVDNALKYSAGPVRVEWERSDGQAEIRISDNGEGIAPVERDAVFQRFVRGSAALALNVKGTGVGLAIVRHIVVAHGGEVRVESIPGSGSTFTLLLPIGRK